MCHIMSKKEIDKGVVTVSIPKEVVVQAERVKVKVTCRSCGEKLVLRGTKGIDGRIDTGFKMCLCGSKDVDVEVIA